MLQIIYISLATITVVRVMLHRINIVGISLLALVFYTFPCAVGEVYIEGGMLYLYQDKISEDTYLLVISQLLIINFLAYSKFKMFKDINKIKSVLGNIQHNNLGYEIVFIFSAIELIYELFIEIGVDVFFSPISKTEIMQDMGTLFTMGLWGILLSFVYAVKKRDIIKLFICGILLLFILIMGARSYPVFAVISVMLLKVKNTEIKVNNRFRWYFVAGAIATLLIIFKNVYKPLRALDFNVVISVLEHYDLFAHFFDIQENRITFSLYNYVVSTDFSLPFIDTMVRILSIVPFLNDFIALNYPLRFSEIAKEIWFHSTFGLGSSFWGESYAMGGSLFLFLITCVWILFIRKFEYKFNEDTDSSPCWIVFLIYTGFYIHRLDWVQVFGAAKSLFLLYLVIIFVNAIPLKKIKFKI